jgi:hypothetical protein
MFKRNATIATNEVLEVAAATVSRSAKWRKALVPLTTLAAAGALAIGSGADFSSQTANPNSIVASGTLTQSNSKANAAIFNVNNLKPGDIVNGDVTITNTVYTGNFGAMGTKSLGTFTAGQAKTYRFTVTFAQSADNSEQGKTASATYTWNGAQTSQVTITQGPAAATATPQAAQ